jgi:hypothetical protein
MNPYLTAILEQRRRVYFETSHGVNLTTNILNLMTNYYDLEPGVNPITLVSAWIDSDNHDLNNELITLCAKYKMINLSDLIDKIKNDIIAHYRIGYIIEYKHTTNEWYWHCQF